MNRPRPEQFWTLAAGLLSAGGIDGSATSIRTARLTVIADLTEHNPNVLFELGMRMREDKPVALIKATGTGRIFDVDNMLRVFEYDSCLWPTTVARDLPKLVEHIKSTWDSRDTGLSYLKLLRQVPLGTLDLEREY